MKKILLLSLFVLSTFSSHAKKSPFIQIESNKVLSLFNFLETATGAHATSTSFKKYIDDNLKNSIEFRQILKDYSHIKFNYQYRIEEIPFSRHSYREIKDLLWIASVNSKNIDDFSNRIIGYLPHKSHVKLIQLFNQTLPIYEKLVWKKQKKSIKRIKKQINRYTPHIKQLFTQISQFYGTSWDKSIPFKIALYPIPLQRGNTTAIPEGNTLIAGFLTKREDDYKARIGVIIHEMCHILFSEQPISLQNKIDTWFNESPSDYSKLAYSYINEGLATALGNGWAYKQINGEEDKSEWYNNKYINGFAHKLYPLVISYIKENKSIDKAFITNSIILFAQAFPDAINETAVLMNEIQLYANSTNEKDINFISSTLRKHFQIRSQWFSTPILSKESMKSFNKQKTSKVFIIEMNNQESLDALADKFHTQLDFDTNKNFIYVFKDENTKSMLVIINIHSLAKLDETLKKLSSRDLLTHGIQWLEQ